MPDAKRDHLYGVYIITIVALGVAGFMIVKKPPECMPYPTSEEASEFLLSEESSFRNCIIVAAGEKGLVSSAQIDACSTAAKTLKKSSVNDPKVNP